MQYNQLTQMQAKAYQPGKYADGQGLWLVKRNRQHGKWVLRLTIHGRRREMGLGPWPDVSIAEARTHATAARKQLRTGADPIIERQKARRSVQRLSVAEAIEGCFAARQAELKGDGAAGRWMSPLKVHVIPKYGRYPIEEIDQHTLKEMLGPIWHTKTEAANKALSRMNLTLKHAAALGLDVDMQAVMKARALLGKQRHTVTHIPSLPYTEAPAFYRWLKSKDNTAALGLRLLILTAARTSEVRLAQASEFVDGIWTLPAERTKTGQVHRIPLVPETQSLADTLCQAATCPFLFTSRSGQPMSDMAMSKFLKDAGYTARPHGLRATFRTWVEEQTDTPFEVKESSLGHAVDTGIVGAYQRSDRLEKRRALLNIWSAFLTGSNQDKG